MKHLVIIACLLIPISSSFGQLITHDPTTLIFSRIKDAADKIWQNKQAVTSAELLSKAISTYNTLVQTKELTGMLVATTKDMKDFTKRFQDDIRSLSDLTGDDLKDLNVLMDWRDALQGRGYQSLIDMDEYYEANTAQLRGADGNFNLANTLTRAVSDEDYLKADQTFRMQQNTYRRIRPINYDYQVRERLRLAREKENEARRLTIKLNLMTFGKRVIGIADGINNLKDGEASQPLAKDTEITELTMAIRNLLHDAGRYRSEALEMMGYNLAHQNKSYKSARDISLYRDKTFLEYQQMKYLDRQLNPDWGNPYQDSYYYNMNPTYDLSFR